MREGATIKQFLDTLDEMRTIYPFKDETTRMAVMDCRTLAPSSLTVVTTDERTGVVITMSKHIPISEV